MVPKDLSLLLGVSRAVADLLPAVAEEEHKAVLRTVTVSLNELLLRQDNSFELAYYQEGMVLIRAGLDLGLGEASAVCALPDQLDVNLNARTISEHVEKVTRILESFVKAASSPDRTLFNEYLNRVTDWEASLYRRRMENFDLGHTARASTGLSRDALQSYLRSKFPDQGAIEVTSFTRLFGGFSKLTVMFSTNLPLFDCTDFVIRAEQASIIEHPGGISKNEFAVMRYAYEQGVRIPEPLWVELDAQKLGARFVVSRKAKGGIFGTTVGASATLETAVLEDLAKELVKIHSIRVDPEDPLVKGSHLSLWADIPTLRENIMYKLEYWRGILATSPHSHSPMIERCFDWLAANIPECDEAASLVHGDYGLHNILIEDGRVNAVLDWEVTHLGDRAQDVIWFIICLVGTASHDEVLRLYHEAGGLPISAERLTFYDVYMSFNLLIICNIALARLDVGGENPALADIGLRAMHVFAERVRAIVK